MTEKLQVFLSYKTVNQGSAPEIAKTIARTLRKDYGFDVFLDVETILPADVWRDTIFEHITKSEVLVLLLTKDTAYSEWVQREVDFARGAKVSLYPLRVEDITPEQLAIATDKLSISDLQQSDYFSGTPEQFAELAERIKGLSRKTRANQKEWIKKLQERWMPTPPAESIARYRTYSISGVPNCKIHLALGDMLNMETFDVIVNSENNFLQMARHHEYTTISSRLRRMGALKKNRRVLEDTLQEELNAALKAQNADRPVEMTAVFVTRAGHPRSELRRIARFIFHAATVRLSSGELDDYMDPISINGVKEAVKNALDAVLELNRTQAADLPSDEDDQTFEPIRSIIFPMIGAGQAGRSTKEVAQPIAEAAVIFVRRNQRNPHFTLTDLYLSAYTEGDALELEQALNTVLAAES